MLYNNPLFAGWYTDTVDIFRVENNLKGNLSSQKRKKINKMPIPCRVYTTQKSAPNMNGIAARTVGTDKLSCDIEVDIQKGDELEVIRGGNIGFQDSTERYFAGGGQIYRDPVGGIMAGLEHREVTLLTDEING